MFILLITQDLTLPPQITRCQTDFGCIPSFLNGRGKQPLFKSQNQVQRFIFFVKICVCANKKYETHLQVSGLWIIEFIMAYYG
jgi:hypothetical protein